MECRDPIENHRTTVEGTDFSLPRVCRERKTQGKGAGNPFRRGWGFRCNGVLVAWRKLKVKIEEQSGGRGVGSNIFSDSGMFQWEIQNFLSNQLETAVWEPGEPPTFIPGRQALGLRGQQSYWVLVGVDGVQTEPRKLLYIAWLPPQTVGAGGERMSHPVPQASSPFRVGPLKPPHGLLVPGRTAFRALPARH